MYKLKSKKQEISGMCISVPIIDMLLQNGYTPVGRLIDIL